MKIGILTHHYVKNFGAYMQAYALLQTVKKIYPSAHVEFIDYRVKKHEFKNCIHFFGFKPKRGDTLNGYIGKIGLFFTHSRYERSLPKSKRVANVDEINALNYDMVIVGADEVWNFNDIAFDPVKFGIGLKTNLISYSASAGGSSIKDIIPPEVKNGIKKFKAIAVRDENTEALVNFVVKDGREVKRTLDPVYLYDYNLEVRKKIKSIVSEPYILIYDCCVTKEQEKDISDFADKHGLNIVGAGEFRKWYTVHAENITPFEWAFLFKNAWGIITGTFHGTSFAIKYERNFVAFLTEQNRINKVGSLLNEFGLKSRILLKEDGNKLVGLLETPIDYSVVNCILKEKKEKSLEYLCDTINQISEW